MVYLRTLYIDHYLICTEKYVCNSSGHLSESIILNSFLQFFFSTDVSVTGDPESSMKCGS